MTKREGASWRRRVAVVAVAFTAATTLALSPALGLNWAPDPDGKPGDVAGPVLDKSNPSNDACPTFADTPPAYDVFFNMSDMDTRGFGDTGNQTPWNFSKRIAQIVCGAADNSTINVGMFFIRALGTLDRPESDPEQIWTALEYVHTKRNVKVNLVLDGGSITSSLGKKQITARLGPNSPVQGNLKWCTNGCYEANASSQVLPNSINHEKFITISDTKWPNSATSGKHPAVYSTSANISRGQTRNYMADGSLIYDDVKMYDLFVNRFKGMQYCDSTNRDCSLSGVNAASGQQLVDGKSLGGSYPRVWVDPLYRHPTDDGRGTTVSFSPQPETARDYFTKMFDDVDCKTDGTVRVGMFRLSDSRAEQFARSAERLAKGGCDIKILLSPKGGMATITKSTAALLKKVGVDVKCSATPLHTKYVLVGSRRHSEGRVLFGTANMSTSGLRYSDEHMLLIDSRRTSPVYRDDARRFFAKFIAGWNEMNKGSTTCNPSS